MLRAPCTNSTAHEARVGEASATGIHSSHGSVVGTAPQIGTHFVNNLPGPYPLRLTI
ncbi:hypothetical protein GCM10011490_10620 [Pseudoclavibacter endophyticus]|nr:hypothetical protein GCM10011490_10620 [Pseudoclavibacter endophyticus]